MLKTSISKNSLLLSLFALITAGILATTQFYTKDRIAIEEKKAAVRALYELIPPTRIDNDLLNDTLLIPKHLLSALDLKNQESIYIARKNNNAIAAIVPTIAPNGYSGAIRIIVGVNRDGSVAGVRALSHKETPGLGDKINLAKSNWILGFNGKSLENPTLDKWAVKKDGGAFDQFTGATITPRAVTLQVKRVLQFVEENHALIFDIKADHESQVGTHNE